MHLMPFHVNRTERPRRTQVLASPATDATGLVHDGQLARSGIPRGRRHHLYRPGRTVAGTVAAFHAIGIHDAVFRMEHGMTYLYGRLVSLRHQPYRPVRTDLRASDAFRPAISPLIGHLGLHPRPQRGRRAQHPVRTGRHTKLTGRAMVREMPKPLRAGRLQRHFPFRHLLLLYGSQSAVHLLLLRLQPCPGGKQ